jgi:hypothetical protein
MGFVVLLDKEDKSGKVTPPRVARDDAVSFLVVDLGRLVMIEFLLKGWFYNKIWNE